MPVERTYLRGSLARFLLCCATLFAPAACVKLPRRAAAPAPLPTPSAGPGTPRLNLNRATRAELERLPGVGPALAARIVEHRERHGPFRRVEHLLAVRGVSERRFAELRPHVTAD